MSRLSGANFARLWKDRCFLECAVFMVSFGAFMVLIGYYMLCRTGQGIGLEESCFDYANVMGFVAAVFVSLFWGTEYSDGTIRNKLVIGHPRSAVYLSGLFVNSAAVLLINGIYVVAVFLAGIPLLGFSGSLGAPLMFKLALLTVLMDLAFAAVYTLLVTLNQNKAKVTAVSILSAIVLLFCSGYISSRLSEPKTYDAYVEVTDKGYVISHEGTEENPYYLAGTKRKVYEFLNDFLPSGQGVQIAEHSADHMGRKLLYSCLIILCSTGAGIVLFEKKDVQ